MGGPDKGGLLKVWQQGTAAILADFIAAAELC